MVGEKAKRLNMNNQNVINIITEICEQGGTFPQKIEKLYQKLSPWHSSDILERLTYAGVIPEMYNHDSSEEKIYAKYCEILVTEAFKSMGFNSKVIDIRSNRADFYIDGLGYSAVCDVKTFRLSRTALNPQDYKIKAVNKWRLNQESDYAFLVGPHPQFPKDISRLYDEALRYNVTLLSFAHIHFLLTISQQTNQPLQIESLFKINEFVKNIAEIRGLSYWNTVDQVVIDCCNGKENDLIQSKQKYEQAFSDYAKLQIQFWENRKIEITLMSQQQLITDLIKAEGIDGKIRNIKKYL